MNSNLHKIIMLVTLFAFLCIMLSGCSLFHSRPNEVVQPPIELTPGQQITEMVRSTNWLVTLSIIGVGAGFFSFLNGSSNGIKIMSSCFVVLSLVLGVAKYASWIALIAVIGAVTLLAYTILVKDKAVKEIVTGVQVIKKRAVDSPKLISKTLAANQSSTTQELVKNVKRKNK